MLLPSITTDWFDSASDPSIKQFLHFWVFLLLHPCPCVYESEWRDMEVKPNSKFKALRCWTSIDTVSSSSSTFFFLSFFRCFAHLKLNQFTDSIYHGIRNRGPHRITGLRRRSWHANYCYLHNLLSFLLIVSHFEASCISMYMVTEYHLSCVWLRKRFIFFAGAFNSLTGKNSILFFADFRHPKFHSGLLFHHI